METVRIGQCEVTRLILGSNPFSGFSHQSAEADLRMVHYYTTARIKEVLAQAERLGINTLIGRADHHIIRVLMEHWDEGGRLQWFAQTCPEVGSPERSIDRAAASGARGVHLHGGTMQFLLSQGQLDQVPPLIDRIHSAGLAAGIAGHNPEVFRWAERVGLEVDYYMCSYYDPSRRDEHPEHVPGAEEKFREADRAAMAGVIQGLSRPAIHYKVLAAGRNEPKAAFEFVTRTLRPGDAVCVGVFTEGRPDMLAEDVRLFQEGLQRTRDRAANSA